MQRPLPKRFYKDVTIAGDGEGHAIYLDDRPVKTPAKNALVVPAAALAELMRTEWYAQADVIDPATMPVTRLVDTYIDGMAVDPQAVFAEIPAVYSALLFSFPGVGPAGG